MWSFLYTKLTGTATSNSVSPNSSYSSQNPLLFSGPLFLLRTLSYALPVGPRLVSWWSVRWSICVTHITRLKPCLFQPALPNEYVVTKLVQLTQRLEGTLRNIKCYYYLYPELVFLVCVLFSPSNKTVACRGQATQC